MVQAMKASLSQMPICYLDGADFSAGSLYNFRHNWHLLNNILKTCDSAWALDLVTNGLDTLEFLSHNFLSPKQVPNAKICLEQEDFVTRQVHQWFTQGVVKYPKMIRQLVWSMN